MAWVRSYVLDDGATIGGNVDALFSSDVRSTTTTINGKTIRIMLGLFITFLTGDQRKDIYNVFGGSIYEYIDMDSHTFSITLKTGLRLCWTVSKRTGISGEEWTVRNYMLDASGVEIKHISQHAFSPDPLTGTTKFIGIVSYKGYIGLLSLNSRQFQTEIGQNWTLGACINVSDLETLGEIPSKETSPEYGDGSEEGGYEGGDFDDSSDPVPFPSAPSIGISSMGFYNVYKPSTGELLALGETLFPEFDFSPPDLPTPTDVVTAVEDVALVLDYIGRTIPDIIAQYANSKLIDYVIDCHLIPVAPSVGTRDNIKVGYKTLSQSSAKVSSDYVDFDCGTLNVNEYYGNFIDYDPFTQYKLFLPFVGFVPCQTDWFVGGSLQVKYRFNIIDGSFIAFVLASSSKSNLSNSVVASYSGNCCVHVPITGINYANMISGVVGGSIGATAQLASGNIASGAITALDTVAQKPQVQSSNGYNAVASFIGIRYPYLVIDRTKASFSRTYENEQGFPCNVSMKLSELSGYAEVGDIHIEGTTATEGEIKEIEMLLKSGVIF